MIPLLGYLTLVLASLLSIAHLAMPSCIWRQRSSLLVCLLMFTSFASLVYSFAVSDFSIMAVYNYSHSAKPLLYKITGTWGNHEGSMLLLATLLSLYTAAFACQSPTETSSLALRLQSVLQAGFMLFILFTSNPFARLPATFENGLGLNPLLQDIGLALHPPVLYMGYIGLSLAFSYAVAALWQGKADKTWAASLTRWVLFSWSFLTLGIALGSWWAYRELGWGGFWFWDPVENASLMPWLAATALLHSLLVMEKRGSLKIWTVLLAILTFSLSLTGIFLVRSGILTSVHAFASDPTRGLYILVFLGVVVSGSLLLFALRGHRLASHEVLTPLSKEGGILLNNLLLVVACFVVFLGTLYPILLDVLASHRVSVGAPYFNTSFIPLALPLLVLAGLVPLVQWKRDTLSALRPKLFIPLAAGLFVAGFAGFVPDHTSLIACLALGCATWLIASMGMLAFTRLRQSSWRQIPLPFYGMVLAHIGVAVLAIGITVTTTWGKENEAILHVDESLSAGPYAARMTEMAIGAENNYLTRVGTYTVTNARGDEIALLHPEVRFYPVEATNTTEAAIDYHPLHNIYVAMGDHDGTYGFAVRIYFQPLINWIWGGAVLMALGGLVAWTKRRTL